MKDEWGGIRRGLSVKRVVCEKNYLCGNYLRKELPIKNRTSYSSPFILHPSSLILYLNQPVKEGFRYRFGFGMDLQLIQTLPEASSQKAVGADRGTPSAGE